MLVERISIEQLKGLIEQGHEPLLVDARSLSAQALEPAIPGAVLFNGGAATIRPNRSVADSMP